MSCKTVLILPSHHPAIQGDEIESEILKTLVSAGTVEEHLSENRPRVSRVLGKCHFLSGGGPLEIFQVL